MLSINRLSVAFLIVILSVIMLSVMAPSRPAYQSLLLDVYASLAPVVLSLLYP
jgi:hypothetical protein